MPTDSHTNSGWRVPAPCVFDLCLGIRLPSSSDDPGRCARLQAHRLLRTWAQVRALYSAVQLCEIDSLLPSHDGGKLLHWGQRLNLSVPQFLYPQSGKIMLITYIVVKIT